MDLRISNDKIVKKNYKKFILPEPYEEALLLANQFEEEQKRCFGIQINQDVSSCLGYWPLLGHCINNLGDPFSGQGGHLVTFDAERELVYFVADLLKLQPDDAWGYFNPGSTFSNLHGVHVGMRKLKDPTLVIATDAHYSWTKSAQITRCKSVLKINTNPNGQMDPSHLREQILNSGVDGEYIFGFCSGSVAKGAFDDVSALINVIKDLGLYQHQYHVHLDAALGGMITPFLEGNPLSLDFSIPEIDTLSVSFHKRIGVPLPGSLFLARKKMINSLPCSIFAECASSYDTTIGGSRDGLSPFMTLHQLKRIGINEFKRRTKEAIDKSDYTCSLLQEKGINAWHNPYSPCVVLPVPSYEMVKRYHLPVFTNESPSYTHIFTFEHVENKVLEEFIDEYIQDPSIVQFLEQRNYTKESFVKNDQPVPRQQITANVYMPKLGIGTYRLTPGVGTYNAIRSALDLGYRHIDAAAAYENEKEVGLAIADSGVPRNELFIVSKLRPSQIDAEKVDTEYETSLMNLGLDYLDLYLVHRPAPMLTQRMAIWSSFESLLLKKRVRSIGVSNYEINQLNEIINSKLIRPAVNQIYLNPFYQNIELSNFCKKNNIPVVAWAPLDEGRSLTHPHLVHIATRNGVSTAQIMLKWSLQQGNIVIPKAQSYFNMNENMQLFHFDLTPDEIISISQLKSA